MKGIAPTDHHELKRGLRKNEKVLDSMLSRLRGAQFTNFVLGLVWSGEGVGDRMMSFEEIEHMADKAFRVTGRDMAALLENAACAMQALDGPRSAREPSAIEEIEVEGVDRESLLVNWLNEILYLEQAHQVVCERLHIDELKNHHLRARVDTRERDRSCTHIKAVTFHNLKIRDTSEGLEAELVVDV